MWKFLKRPGMFGTRRDLIINSMNDVHGKDNWRLVWLACPHPDDYTASVPYDFLTACKFMYETSYYQYMRYLLNAHMQDLCSFGDCYDNAVTNVDSGNWYSVQEASSTHIQDIAIRNVLYSMNLKFEGPKHKLIQIRHSVNKHYLSTLLSPGTVPYYEPKNIIQPSLRPKWAEKGSVEDFWQSNKWIQVKE